MVDIRIKRVYEDYNSDDGYRVLVDRLWPRGIKKEHLQYDLWAKDITPSTELRMFFHEDTEGRWDLFTSKYSDELKNSTSINDFIKKVEKYPVITLLYASKDQMHNHAIILKKYLYKELKRDK